MCFCSKESSAGSSIVPRSPVLHERVFNLEDDKIDTTSTVIQHIQSNSTNLKQIWHHLPNLSSDTRHDISLSVCNTYACSKSSALNSRFGSSSSRFTFKTPEFDGKYFSVFIHCILLSECCNSMRFYVDFLLFSFHLCDFSIFSLLCAH